MSNNTHTLLKDWENILVTWRHGRLAAIRWEMRYGHTAQMPLVPLNLRSIWANTPSSWCKSLWTTGRLVGTSFLSSFRKLCEQCITMMSSMVLSGEHWSRISMIGCSTVILQRNIRLACFEHFDYQTDLLKMKAWSAANKRSGLDSNLLASRNWFFLVCCMGSTPVSSLTWLFARVCVCVCPRSSGSTSQDTRSSWPRSSNLLKYKQLSSWRGMESPKMYKSSWTATIWSANVWEGGVALPCSWWTPRIAMEKPKWWLKDRPSNFSWNLISTETFHFSAALSGYCYHESVMWLLMIPSINWSFGLDLIPAS